MSLVGAGGVVTMLIPILQDWLTRNNQRSMKLEIDGDTLELTGISAKEQQQLTNAWLSRHRLVVIADD
jgi:hypothetical protein